MPPVALPIRHGTSLIDRRFPRSEQSTNVGIPRGRSDRSYIDGEGRTIGTLTKGVKMELLTPIIPVRQRILASGAA